MLATPEGRSQDASFFDSSFPKESGQSPSVRVKLNAKETIAYLLRWNWKSATWSNTDKAYVFQNDLGYTIGLEEGYVGTTAMQMVACNSGADEFQKMGWLRLLRTMDWGVRAAYADHAFTDDSSIVSEQRVEIIHQTQVVLFGRGPASGKEYCKVHVLYTPLTQEAPNGVRVKRSSAVLRGWYKSPGTSQKVKIDGFTPLTGGTLVMLSGPDSIPNTPSRYNAAVTVTLVRDAVKAFQGIHFKKLSSLEYSYKFLQQLSLGTTAHVQTQ